MKLNKLARRVHEANVEKGFYEESSELRTVVALNAPELLEAFDSMLMGQRLALITSETSEMLEADRKGIIFNKNNSQYSRKWKESLMNMDDEDFKLTFAEYIKDTVEDELADGMIRYLDTAGANKFDVDFHIQAKLRYNSLRPKKHGKTY